MLFFLLKRVFRILKMISLGRKHIQKYFKRRKFEHSQEYFGFYVNIMGWLGILPFYYNKNLQIVSKETQRVSKFVVFWNCAMLLCELKNVILESHNSKVTLIERMYTLFLIAAYNIASMMSINLVMKKSEIVNLYNQLYEFKCGKAYLYFYIYCK